MKVFQFECQLIEVEIATTTSITNENRVATNFINLGSVLQMNRKTLLNLYLLKLYQKMKNCTRIKCHRDILCWMLKMCLFYIQKKLTNDKNAVLLISQIQNYNFLSKKLGLNWVSFYLGKLGKPFINCFSFERSVKHTSQ